MTARLRAPRRAALTLVVAGVLLAYLLPAVADQVRGRADTRSPQPPAITAPELVAYEDALTPVVKDWGSIEILGMRPAIADLRAGTEFGRPELVAVQARAWRAALELDRRKLTDLSPPTALRQTHELLLDSMDRYLAATASFLAATAADAADRERLIDEGIRRAKDGAQVYNRASALLQSSRRELGLGSSPTFPDPAG
jgi:hypothetical protein